MTDVNPCAVCMRPAELKCSACRNVSYCSKEHQKNDWKNHKNVCKAYEIKQSPELGRYLVASRDLSPGDLVLSELPLIIGPRLHSDEAVCIIPCIGCHLPLPIEEPPARCPGCMWPACNTHCPGLTDLKGHANECPILQMRCGFAVNNIPDFYRFDALTPLRCLLIQKRDPKKWKQITEMESHQDKRGPKTDVYKETEERIVKYLHQNYIVPLKDFENDKNITILHDFSKETLHKICGILDVNSLEIHLNTGSDLSALYPTAYLLEHNCLPNTRHIFNIGEDPSKQFKISVSAAVPIKKGEHITTMYTHALWGTQARRQHLLDTKYFACQCQRCKDPTELGTYLSALKCLGTDGAPCDGIQLAEDPCNEDTDWKCSKCPVKVNNKEVSYLIGQIGNEVDNVQAQNATVKHLEALLTKISTFLHPHHYHIYSIKHSLIQLYGYQQGYSPKELTEDQLKRKIDMCRELIDITNKLDPGHARLTLYSGVLLHELHLGIMQLINRKWKDTMNKTALIYQVKEAKQLLEKAQRVLADEAEGSAGYKLAELVGTSQRDLKRWMRDNKVKFNN